VLLAGHQRGGSVGFFELDARTGMPAPLGKTVAVDKPACLLPVPR
jgi:hypothetical protein